MTTPATHPPAAPATLDEAIERIRSNGGRLTPAKRTVLGVLFAPGPARTAEEIADAAAGVDRSIVYRCLKQFEELGIAAHVHPGHGQAVYRRRGLATVPVACATCGTVVELDAGAAADIIRIVTDATGVEPDLVHFPLTGRCAGCRAGTNGATAG